MKYVKVNAKSIKRIPVINKTGLYINEDGTITIDFEGSTFWFDKIDESINWDNLIPKENIISRALEAKSKKEMVIILKKVFKTLKKVNVNSLRSNLQKDIHKFQDSIESALIKLQESS